MAGLNEAKGRQQTKNRPSYQKQYGKTDSNKQRNIANEKKKQLKNQSR